MTGGPTIEENFAKKHKILLEKNVFFVEKSRFPTKKAEIFSKKKNVFRIFCRFRRICFLKKSHFYSILGRIEACL